MDNAAFPNRKILFKEFHRTMESIIAKAIKANIKYADQTIPQQPDTLFLYAALENGTENEFIIDLELNYDTGTALLYHIALPQNMRNKGLGTMIVHIIERLAGKLGLQSITLPAEHNSTGFWLKLGYQFRYPVEKIFYNQHSKRQNLNLAYDLHKNLQL